MLKLFSNKPAVHCFVLETIFRFLFVIGYLGKEIDKIGLAFSA